MTGSIVAKTIIVAVAFPLFAHVIYSGVTFVLGLVLPQLLDADGPWFETVRKGAVLATVLVAARISFGICRRLWPTPRIVNPDAQASRAMAADTNERPPRALLGHGKRSEASSDSST